MARATLGRLWRIALVATAAASVTSKAVSAQAPRRVAEGVYLVAGPRNVAWVELGPDILAIVPDRSAASVAALRRHADRPIRALFATSGGVGPDSSFAALELIPESRRATAGPASIRFTGSVMLGPRSVEIREMERAVWPGNGIVHVPDAGVLFVGDLAGPGTVLDSVRSGAWLVALERLERLAPRVVVTGSGPAGGPELLRQAREALVAGLAHARAGIDRRLPIDSIAGSSPTPRLTRHLAREMVGLVPPAMIDELELRAGPSFTAATPGWTRPRIVVINDLWPGKGNRIGELSYVAPGVEIRVPRSAQETTTLVADADGFMGQPAGAVVRAGRKLRWIQSVSAGVEGAMAIPGFADSEILLTNAQKIYAPPLVEHVFGLLLGLTRKLHVAVPLMKERTWADDPVVFPPTQMPELRGKTLLVAGLGGIGTEVAHWGHAMGMRVIATRNNPTPPTARVEYVGASGELGKLAASADVIVNALPLTPSTRNVFDAAVFAAMKPTAYFINIGRGGTVDTEALTQALESKRLAGAGLDVTSPEPLPATHRLWTLPNVIITPHVGSSSDWERERTWILFRENLRRFVAGEPLLSVVDKKAAY
ncbi:MAG: hypothetical protein FJ206_00640 [Gemmatimonadetes bacterium]|nr:hypothetical protein [Gemmatimonadota bacterium]